MPNVARCQMTFCRRRQTQIDFLVITVTSSDRHRAHDKKNHLVGVSNSAFVTSPPSTLVGKRSAKSQFHGPKVTLLIEHTFHRRFTGKYLKYFLLSAILLFDLRDCLSCQRYYRADHCRIEGRIQLSMKTRKKRSRN